MVLCDRAGTRMPAVRENMQKKIGEVYKGLDISIDCFPADDVADDPDAFTKVGPRERACLQRLATHRKLPPAAGKDTRLALIG
jgi:hypothetical protein